MASAFVCSSLSRQFLMVSFPVLLTGMVVIGYLVGKQAEEIVLHRMGAETGHYVDSFVAPHVQSLVDSDDLNDADRAALAALLTQTPLGKRIVTFKIWRPDGRILYSTNASLIGQSFPVGEGLTEALAGRVHAEISEMSVAENPSEVDKWHHMVESYMPILARGVGKVIAIAEFYQPVDEVMHESAAAQRQSWLVVAPTTALIYLLLFILVRRGSQTIDRQRRELNEKVAQLTLNAQNERLHDRVRRAAASTTALNENFLRRISADLHDGPGQDLGFALMRFESITDLCSKCLGGPDGRLGIAEALSPIHSAIKSALADLRSISANLRLPEIDQLTLNEIATRAVRDYEGKTGIRVALLAADSNPAASLPVKIALYRLLQESLANGFRHALGVGQRVEIKNKDSRLLVKISDDGPGFDQHATVKEGCLGLVGMRERAEVLGGSFDLQSRPGLGTVIRVNLPLVVPEMEYD